MLEFWREVALNAVDPVFVLDADHRCWAVSEGMTLLTGLASGEMIGERLETLVMDADGSSVAERLDRAGESSVAEFGMTLRTSADLPFYGRAFVRRIRRHGLWNYVVVVRRNESVQSTETALWRRLELDKLLERIQHQFINAVPTEIDGVISAALHEVAEFLGADRGYLLAFDARGRTETMTHEWTAPGIEAELETYVDVPLDLAPAASRRNNNLWVSAVPDVSKLTGEWARDREFFEASGIRSILELPVIVDGVATGSLGFDWINSLSDWTEDDLTILGVFASTFAQLLGRDVAERELVRRANHDELTGLPNRSGLLSKLRAALAACRDAKPESVVGVLVIDLDQFKVVNDSLGNEAGDDLLCLVGNRLRGLVRPSDIVARLGGDEFVLVLVDTPDEWTVSQLSDRLRDSLAEPYQFRGRDHLLTVSIGIATSSSDGEDAEELLRQAGAAMYRAKELGRARQSVFDGELEQRIAERLELDQRLRRAKDRDEFEVHYQPEIDLLTGRTVGVEALLRWRTDGVLRPAFEFIDVVEETGLIIPVGRWVLEQACREAARWSALPGQEDFVVRVNLSPRQLEQPDLVDQVRGILDTAGLDPRRLCLEITETALMSNAEAALATLTRLDSLGVTLAIDDFGTGYSSLSYLKRFPVDILKIDRSFVDGLPVDSDDLAIVDTVVHLAASLGMTVTAEGIETREQSDALVALSCVRGQGWLYSPAIPAEEIDQRLTEVIEVTERIG